MIPKVIHYCWFGGNPLSEDIQKCISSWKKYCPDYKIKEWNETNFDLNCCNFVREAYKAKKWAFLSDCARLYIIYNEGGIYLDTDVELLQSLDGMLQNKCFLGEETSGYINTGLGFGAEKKNLIIYDLLQEYLSNSFLKGDGSYDMIPCPIKNTIPLQKLGYKFSGTEVWIGEDVTVYPPEYFCPLDYVTNVKNITDKTISIHHYNESWHNVIDKIIIKIEKCDERDRILEYKMRRIISLPFRVIKKIQKLINRILYYL